MIHLKAINSEDPIIVDDEDAEMLSKFIWRVNNQGYAITCTKTGRPVHLHRLLCKQCSYRSIDHKNRNRLDYRRSNLRYATAGEQVRNRGINSNNSTGYKGVAKTPEGKFRAYITYAYKRQHIGHFWTAKEAAKAYNKKATELFGAFACLNEIKEDVNTNITILEL